MRTKGSVTRAEPGETGLSWAQQRPQNPAPVVQVRACANVRLQGRGHGRPLACHLGRSCMCEAPNPCIGAKSRTHASVGAKMVPVKGVSPVATEA